MILRKKRLSVLAIGGLDPSGGAGIIIDSASLRSLKLHAATICSVITVQNGKEFIYAKNESADQVAVSIEKIVSLQDVRAIKTGALGNSSIIKCIAEIYESKKMPPLVIDPVMKSTTDGQLIDALGVEVMVKRLFPQAAIVTPNLAEAQVLCQKTIENPDQMVSAAGDILDMGPKAVLLKGGHLVGDEVVDVFAAQDGTLHKIKRPRLNIGEVRGTGCALASLIAGLLALGNSMEDSVLLSIEKLKIAMENSYLIDLGAKILFFNH